MKNPNGFAPILTFDQPLWMKATIVVEAEQQNNDLKKLILRLGGFHTQMSFLGSMGHLMSGTGLEYLLGNIYAPTTVGHMLTGKAYARAVRGHFLVETALGSLLLSQIYPSSVAEDNRLEKDR